MVKTISGCPVLPGFMAPIGPSIEIFETRRNNMGYLESHGAVATRTAYFAANFDLRRGFPLLRDTRASGGPVGGMALMHCAVESA